MVIEWKIQCLTSDGYIFMKNSAGNELFAYNSWTRIDWSLVDWDNQDSITLMFECNGHTQVTSVFSSGIVSYANSTDYPGLTEVFGQCYYDPEGPDADQFLY